MTKHTALFIGILLLITVCINATYVSAQKNRPVIDSLLAFNTKPMHDTSKVICNCKLSDAYKLYKADSGMYYLNICDSIAQKVNYNKGRMMALTYYALFTLDKSDYKKAQLYLDTLHRLMLNNHDSTYYVSYANSSGICYNRLGNYNAALDMYIKAIKYSEAHHEFARIPAMQINIGTIYRRQLNDYKMALAYFEKARTNLLTYPDEQLSWNLNSAFGSIYLEQYKIDSAVYIYKMNVDISLKRQNKEQIIIGYLNIANAFKTSRVYDSTFYYAQEALHISKNEKPTTWHARGLHLYAEATAHLGNTDTAIKCCAEAIQISKNVGDVQRLLAAYKSMVIICKLHKDFESALSYNDSLVHINDSINSNSVAQNLNELNLKYETEIKDATIKQFETAKKISKLELEKQEAIIAGNYKEAQQKETEISLLKQTSELGELRIIQQQNDLQQKSLQTIAQEQQLQIAAQQAQIDERQILNQKLIQTGIIAAFISALVFGFVFFNRYQLKKKLEQQQLLEKERTRISSDLHDELGSGLTAIAMMSNNPRTSGNNMNDISGTANTLIDNMREMVWALNTKNDTLENLISYIHEYAQQTIQHSSVKLNMQLPATIADKKLTGEVRRNILLTVKEVINNALKYSDATELNLKIMLQQNQLQINIADNGKGFDMSNVRKNGSGLKNIQERMKEIGGSAQIITKQGNGTDVKLQIELK
ncbi:MAG: tetratricopeptide repeat protein [Bacteroidetes bacterium]|nr:tetratricopeptide repeat protein [Bacteroidota bacterium]